jgi:hypothetical protein
MTLDAIESILCRRAVTLTMGNAALRNQATLFPPAGRCRPSTFSSFLPDKYPAYSRTPGSTEC